MWSFRPRRPAQNARTATPTTNVNESMGIPLPKGTLVSCLQALKPNLPPGLVRLEVFISGLMA